jgi:exonuclease 3'-5' domain-containing protein 1
MATKNTFAEGSSADHGKSGRQDSLDLATLLEKTSLGSDQPRDFIDTVAALASLVDTLSDLPTTPPSLYIDLEGVNLSRQGTLSILQVFVLPRDQTYLVDIHTLQEKAFSTAGANGQTLKSILESDAIPKAFFDVRNDSDALYSHYNVNLAGIHDIQLMELATRSFSKRCVNGLSRCIEREAPMSPREKKAWKDAKERGLDMFAPERGGTYEVFNTRPLPKEIKEYCMQDVQFLSTLWVHYDRKMTPIWLERVKKATRDRIALSKTSTYNGKGRHMALAPSGWA